MPANVLITKYIEDDFIVYYQVKAVEYGDQEFYIAVHAQEKIIIFYKDYSFSRSLGSINLSDVSKPLNEIKGIYLEVSNRVAFQVYKALQKQKLENDLSYISH